MDLDLTKNAFRRFVRGRGLSRDRPDAHDDADGKSGHIGNPGSSSNGASSSRLFNDDMRQFPSSHEQRTTNIPQQRASSTYVRPRGDMHGHHRAGANYPHAEGSIRRVQSQADTGTLHTPPRRARRQDEDGSKKQYHCEYCNLQFGRKHHKERHVANIHRHEKPYVCNICGHPFHQKPNLDRHRATVHAEVNPFRCEECGAMFHRRNQLNTHMQAVHDKSRR